MPEQLREELQQLREEILYAADKLNSDHINNNRSRLGVLGCQDLEIAKDALRRAIEWLVEL